MQARIDAPIRLILLLIWTAGPLAADTVRQPKAQQISDLTDAVLRESEDAASLAYDIFNGAVLADAYTRIPIPEIREVRLGENIPEIGQQDDLVWEVRVYHWNQRLQAIIWVHPVSRKYVFVFGPLGDPRPGPGAESMKPEGGGAAESPSVMESSPEAVARAARQAYMDGLKKRRISRQEPQEDGTAQAAESPVPSPEEVARGARKAYLDALKDPDKRLPGAQCSSPYSALACLQEAFGSYSMALPKDIRLIELFRAPSAERTEKSFAWKVDVVHRRSGHILGLPFVSPNSGAVNWLFGPHKVVPPAYARVPLNSDSLAGSIYRMTGTSCAVATEAEARRDIGLAYGPSLGLALGRIDPLRLIRIANTTGDLNSSTGFIWEGFVFDARDRLRSIIWLNPEDGTSHRIYP